MKKGLFIVSLFALVGSVNVAPIENAEVKAVEEIPLTDFSIEHGKDGSEYEVLVGEVVKIVNSEYTFTPSNASNQHIAYELDPSSFTGTLPPVMFSNKCNDDEIYIKGLAVGDFKFFVIPLGNETKKETVKFRCVSELTTTERPGLSVIETQEDNGITPGATSVYETTIYEGATPIFDEEGSLNLKAVPQFIATLIDIKFYIILGASIVGLAFLYVLIYNIKKIIWKSRR